MHEDFEQIAHLKFGKTSQSISGQTLERVRDMQREYAARAPFPGARSGPHEAAIANVYIEGAERLARALCDVWVDLIKQRKGHISHPDVGFISAKVEGYTKTKKGHLNKIFAERRMGPAGLSSRQKAESRMRAVSIETRRDLEIMAHEYEVFLQNPVRETERKMERQPKRRFSAGRRVLVGQGSRPGTIVSVDDVPSTLGEFRHLVTLDSEGQAVAVLGCDLQPLPGLDEDLTAQRGTTFNGDQIHNYSPVGAVGRGAQGVVNINDRSTNLLGDVDFQILAAQLETLRNEFRKTAVSREDDKQLSLLAEAAEAAEKGDDHGVSSFLSKVSKSVLGAAKDIGTDVAAKVIAEILKAS
jgi:hypothetical protein